MTIEAYIPKHAYFSTSLTPTNMDIDRYENSKVLELYGNAGTLLNDPENRVKEENYTVFDSDQEAIDQGKADFPNADFRMWGVSENNFVLFDASTEKVGIGNTSPVSKLDVGGDITSTHITASGNISASGTNHTLGGRVSINYGNGASMTGSLSNGEGLSLIHI